MEDDARFSTDDLSAATGVEPRGDRDGHEHGPGGEARRREDARFRLRVSDGWHQGRGVFGGLVMGAMTRAMASCEPDADRPLRSICGSISAPVATGDADIDVTPLRRGTAVTTLAASLAQPAGAGHDVLAQATAIFGKKRQDARRWAPDRPSPAASFAATAAFDLRAPLAPEFTQHFEMRPLGALPFAGASSSPRDAVAEGWLRPRRPPLALGAAELVALADVWWPATFAIERAPRPIATVAFTLQLFLPDEALDPAAPFFHRARATAAADGYVVEMRELWAESGVLLALNQQTFVMIR